MQTEKTGYIDWTQSLVFPTKPATETAVPVSDIAAPTSASVATRLTRTLRLVQVDAESTVDDWMNRYPALERRVASLSERLTEPDNVTPGVPLAQPLYGRDGITALLLPLELRALALSHPPPGGKPAPDGAEYTGIIVDARGLPVVPALFPRLLNREGRVLFDCSMADPNQVAEHGWVTYVSSAAEFPGRYPAGEQPLRVAATGIAGNVETDLIVNATMAGTLAPQGAAPFLVVIIGADSGQEQK